MESVNTQFRWMTEFCSAGPNHNCGSWLFSQLVRGALAPLLHMTTSFLTREISSNLSPPAAMAHVHTTFSDIAAWHIFADEFN